MTDTRPKGVSKTRLVKLVRDGLPDRVIAARLGVHPMTVRWHRRNFGLPGNKALRRWTPDELAAARAGVAGGRPLSRIGQDLGRTAGAVREALARAGRGAA